MTKGKKFGLAFFGLIVAIIVVAIVWPRNQAETRELLTVAKGDVVQAVDMTGSLTYPETRRAAFMTSGRMSTLNVMLGDTVQAGQVLATLENPTPEVANDVYRLASPIDGVVTAIYAFPGEVVGAGAPVVLVQGPARVYEVAVEATENDVVRLFVGDEATVTFDAIDDATFAGEIVAIAPVATTAQGVVTYAVRVQLDGAIDGGKGAWSQLRAGLTSDVTVVTARAVDVIAVPRRAVIVRDGVSYVRVVADNDASYDERVVTTGLRGDDGKVVIVDGLGEGDAIIVKE